MLRSKRVRQNRYVIDGEEKLGFYHVLLFGLFLLGAVSSFLFLIYVISGIMFISGYTSYPGDIVYIPKSVFLLIPFILLRYNRKVEEIIEKF